MTKRVFIVGVHPQSRGNAIEAVRTAPTGHCVTVAEPTRSLEQNARLWACLGDIAGQVDWYGKRLSPEDWKHIFSSSLRKTVGSLRAGIDPGQLLAKQP